MWKWLKSCPLLLGVLCCVTFVYNGNGWQLDWHGMIMGLIALGVMGIVLMYRAYKSLQQLWLENGLSLRKVKKYDKWVVALVFLSMLHGRWEGRIIEGLRPNEMVPQWLFAWSDPTWQVPFLLALVAVLFLYKILVLTKGLSEK